jgi:hypothetical protein
MNNEPLIDARNLERKTLRDEFAMAALQGLCANQAMTAARFAQRAYELADAMLAERAK